jgi:competence protein ComEC
MAPIVHFLNVKEGDCNIIQHMSGHTTVIDVCNASPANALLEAVYEKLGLEARKGLPGDFGQKEAPVNPISYMNGHNIASVFRFVLTHPDMDHMDGMKAFFEAFPPLNFWDTDNNETKDFGDGTCGRFKEEDWDFYTGLRDANPRTAPKRLMLHSGASGQFYNRGENNESGGDGLHILAPSQELVTAANECGDYNDCSYVLLYKTTNKGKTHRILFGGDSHDETWEHILKEHEADVKDVDLLIAPHHGRRSDRSHEFLDVVNPALTLFGNADSEYLAYSAYSNRSLPIITNNQAGCVLVDAEENPMQVYVMNEDYAKKANAHTFASSLYAGYYYWGLVERK